MAVINTLGNIGCPALLMSAAGADTELDYYMVIP